ncbi:NAD(P)H-binding protein [Mucilaginibacter sp. RT5R15]|nr:NAD(P)H-binding protein [Mucilaginibacter flavidus]
MNILILGATGRTGRHLVSETLKLGFEVHVLVRDKSKLPVYPPSVSVFEGTPAVKDDLAKAMQGCDAILSSLNISRTSDFPWAKLRTPKDFLSASMKNIIATAGEINIKRIVITTAWA